MLVQFSVSNFLSFDEKETFSMFAGKARKNNERIYIDKRNKITKCKVILGANASGKSNLVSALDFMQDMVIDGLPRGFSNKYFKLNSKNKNIPSEFELIFFCGTKLYCYKFSIMLAIGSVLKESLYEINTNNLYKLVFDRDTVSETFEVGRYFKNHYSVLKIENYGEDSVSDQNVLFLNIINKNKDRMFVEYEELGLFKDIYNWFEEKLNISFPNTVLTGYPYFTDANLDEIADLLKALGTGISKLKIVDVPLEFLKSKVPEKLFNRVTADLEKAFTNKQKNGEISIMIRSYKEFYTFSIGGDGKISATTIEFSHEKEGVFFDLKEESDGTARLLDLIEILFKISNDSIFVVDEIDRCLHPSMTVKAMNIFLELAKIRNTQLIVTTHESRLLGANILRNDEICFVSKNRNGASKIESLEKFQLRTDKNVYVALFDGSIDAVPKFDADYLKKFIDNYYLDKNKG